MSAPPPKICPECREEFVHTALRCADCDVDLVMELPSETVQTGGGAALPPASELTPLLRGGPWELEPVALALAEAGIASRIDAYEGTGGGRLAIYVREEELQAAARAVEAHRAEHLHDAPEPGALGEALHDCPACGSRLPEDAAECPDCGLPFAEVPA